MFTTRRNFLKGAVTGLAAGALYPKSGWISALRAAPIPVKIGVTDWNLRQRNNPASLELAKRIGFDGVEISFGRGTDSLPLSDPEMQRQYLEEAKKHGIEIAGTHLGILHRNGLKSDPLGKRWVADAIPVTAKLGTRVILVPFFGDNALRTHQEMDHTADILKELAPEAEKHDVVLGLENTNSAEENVRILDRVQSKSVMVYYDVGNSTRSGFDVIKEIRWLGRDRICQFHLKDNPHFMGEGEIDFPGIAKAIADIGYSGWAMLETSSPTRSIENDMRRNLEYTRNLIREAA